MTYNMTMRKVNVHEAKARLSEFLASGERVVICNRNVPVAELRPLRRAERSKEPRPMGPLPGFRVEGVDALLERDEEMERLFEGGDL